ncbi:MULTISPECIES: hypothetical protein [unclassified Kaistella]|uniref:type I restriction endonuclease subunit R, EcoR124 family n=1 Tax=unclassified Kaistella TaxID=2762626 RepID=UPI002736E14C|nr:MULTISPECIES: hypothetical protein [unclassified Kaistella]MDP2455275.1 hypothetical protein [Kaistella sp. SH11-4b]MDP2458213.1 hypothetical protein [Kaistella sp. SH40-3]MDP2461092.1 hypothetical protein [Kaistella sp. SH19-2b]
MQGKKIITPQHFYHQSLDEVVPEDNFYRKVNENLSLDFLYKVTAPYYGKCGQESIDPVVFFKILMVGYLNSINSDRGLNEEAAKRYISNSLKREFASDNGMELNALLPKMSPLNPQYLTKKQSVFQKLVSFVEKFKGVGGQL